MLEKKKMPGVNVNGKLLGKNNYGWDITKLKETPKQQDETVDQYLKRWRKEHKEIEEYRASLEDNGFDDKLEAELHRRVREFGKRFQNDILKYFSNSQNPPRKLRDGWRFQKGSEEFWATWEISVVYEAKSKKPNRIICKEIEDGIMSRSISTKVKRLDVKNKFPDLTNNPQECRKFAAAAVGLFKEAWNKTARAFNRI